jgi:hypothetical protein
MNGALMPGGPNIRIIPGENNHSIGGFTMAGILQLISGFKQEKRSRDLFILHTLTQKSNNVFVFLNK